MRKLLSILATVVLFSVLSCSKSDSNDSANKGVNIHRDSWGVPHIIGGTDEATAYGFGYAHAEDDWNTIQAVFIASQGNLRKLRPDKLGYLNDVYVKQVGIWEQVEAQYDALLHADTRKVLEGYARGINDYAKKNPSRVHPGLRPLTGKDVAANIIHKLPLFLGYDKVVTSLTEPPSALDELSKPQMPQAPYLQSRYGEASLGGSNAHAVSKERSSDNVSRLNINSHQPWEGPVAWYEAHLISDEGWNLLGATFPGSPVVLQGHNSHLGWAHTVNRADYIDVFRLEVNADRTQYKFDEEWKNFEVIPLGFDVENAPIPLSPVVLRTVHGPVVVTGRGEMVAIRYAGMGNHLLAIEQWYRMGKAKNFSEWLQAMEMHAIPMFNTVYADRDNIHYVYNALLPNRITSEEFGQELDWTGIVPGNTSRTFWRGYVPFKKLPKITNPQSGFVHNCNNSPYQTTVGPENPKPQEFATNLGITHYMTNRGLRSLELFGGTDKVSRKKFLEWKFDQQYTDQSRLVKDYLKPWLASYTPVGPKEKQGKTLLENWDRSFSKDSKGAGFVVLALRKIYGVMRREGVDLNRLTEGFKEAIAFFESHYGGDLETPLTTVQRLRRGKTDLPLSGGPDVLNAIDTKIVEGKLVGRAGDSYVMLVEFHEDGPKSWAIHQYGNSNNPDSLHYDDQANLFILRKLRPSVFDRKEIETLQGYSP